MARSFVSHAAVYGLGSLLMQAAGFLLLPIYLRCLSREDNGVLEVIGRLAETVGMVLLLGGFRQALFTFYKQAEGETAKRQIVTGAYLLVCVAGLLGLGLLFAFSDRLLWLLSLDGYPDGDRLFWLAVLAILIEPLSLMPLTLIQARLESVSYAIIVFCQLLFRLSLTVFLVRFAGWGILGALVATAVTGVLSSLTLTLWELSRGICLPSTKQIRDLLAFALPLLPGGLCYFVLHNGDRFFLVHFGPRVPSQMMGEVGTYGVVYKLGMVVRLFSLVPLYMVWSARMYDVARTPDAGTTFGKAFTGILSAYLFAGLGLSLFAPEALLIVGGTAWFDASLLVAPVVLAYFFLSAATLAEGGFFVRRQMGRKLLVTLAATVVMLGLYALLIPRYGSMGAALATVAGFAFLFVATVLASQPIFAVRYEWGRLFALFALASCLWAVGRLIPVSIGGVVAKSGLILLAPLTAWLTGLVRPEEKQRVRQLAATLLARFRKESSPEKVGSVSECLEAPSA